MPRCSSIVALALCAAGAASSDPQVASAQQPAIVSNHVEISPDEASLHLELFGGEELEIVFARGEATANGQSLGSYEPNGAADRAWRDLLDTVLHLANGPLARELDRWRPPSGVPSGDLDVLRELDAVLQRTVSGRNAAAPTDRAVRVQDSWDQDMARWVIQLLARDLRIGALEDAFEGVDFESMEIVLDEDYTVTRGATIDHSILLADGELEVRGRIREHAIVLDGVLLLEEGGQIDGDVRLIDAEFEERGGTLRGEVVHAFRDQGSRAAEDRDRVREEIRRELAQSGWNGGRRQSPSRGVLSRTGRAAEGVVGTGVTFLVLAVLALLMSRLAGHRIDAVTQALQASERRCLMLGLAGGVLALPLYAIGAVVLAVTVVGIPALLLWVPGYPVVLAAAAFAGALAAARLIGQWILGQGISWLDRVDRHSPIQVKLAGLGTLLAPFALASVLSVLPVLGWLAGFVKFLGTLACVVAVLTGLGGVIITRGGKYPVSDSLDYTLDEDEWSSALDNDPAPEDEFGSTEAAADDKTPGDGA